MPRIDPRLAALLLAAGPAAAQLPLAPFPNTDITYTVRTEIDTRDPKDVPRNVLGNAYLKAFVTLKNNAAERRKLVLCLTGKSIPQDNGRRSPARGVMLVYDATAKQFTCEPEAQTPMKAARHGNMGCQTTTLAAGAETVLTFVSGSSPGVQRLPTDPPPNAAALAAQITDNKVVQDGNRRDINGAGLVPGHRMQTSLATFGGRSLYAAMDSWMLQLLVLQDENIELGCMKKDDVEVKPGEAAYTEPCLTPVDATRACNKCFGMNTYMSKTDPPANVVRSIVSRDVTQTIPQPPRQVGWRLPVDPGSSGAAPRLLVLALSYLPGPRQPGHLLRYCDPALPGCFATEPPPGVPFFVPQDGPVDHGTLTANLPSTLPSNFAADFFATYSDAVSGEIVAQNWLRLRPRLACDFNEDGRVDTRDIELVFQSIGSVGGAGSQLDVDNDGKVTVNDARVCTLRCTKPRCAS